MKIVVLSGHTPSLVWFRMDMMKSFLQSGYEVVAVGNENCEKWQHFFGDQGVKYRNIAVKRNGINPISDIKTFLSIIKLLRQESPDKIFCYQAKTIIYGSIAAWFLGIKEVYALVAGVGSVFLGNGWKNFFVRKILLLEYKVAFKNCERVFFQNRDDSDVFLKRQILREDKITYINGSGVNTDVFYPKDLPDTPAFLFVGRLIKDKGVVEYLEACRYVKKKYPIVRCMLVGPFDTNPTALKPCELDPYIEDGTIEFFGEQSDVRRYIWQSSVFVLPSYHEGTPKTILEAMSCGRAVITTNAPGCRETVEDGVNGYLVKVKSVDELVEKMELLIADFNKCIIMGHHSRKIAIERFDVTIVNKKINETMKV